MSLGECPRCGEKLVYGDNTWLKHVDGIDCRPCRSVLERHPDWERLLLMVKKLIDDAARSD